MLLKVNCILRAVLNRVANRSFENVRNFKDSGGN
jgi:hypothetical protein